MWRDSEGESMGDVRSLSESTTALKAGDPIGTPIVEELPRLKLRQRPENLFDPIIDDGLSRLEIEDSRPSCDSLSRYAILPTLILFIVFFVGWHNEYRYQQNRQEFHEVFSNLREINVNQHIFQENHKNQQFGTLKEIIQAGKIDSQLAYGEWQGYRYEFGLAANRELGYWIKVSPIEPKRGRKYYFTNESTVIKWSKTDFSVDTVNCEVGEDFIDNRGRQSSR